MMNITLHKQGGMSLVELMIATTLGLLILAGVSQIYLSNKRAYTLQEEMSRLQENARFSMHTLTRDTRLADFWGCNGSLVNVSSDLDPAGNNYINFLSAGLGGTENGTTDTLLLRSAHGGGIPVVTPYMPTPSAVLQVMAGANLNAGDILLVSDCLNGDIFQATNLNPSGAKTQIVHNTGSPSIVPGNLTGNLSKTYEGDAYIYRVREVVYSIQTAASGEPGLFRTENGNSLELVPGVEEMQILYGEDTDNDGSTNRYVSANTPGLNMDNVVALRIGLTLRSESNRLSTSGDGRIRHQFTTTITLRNRAG